MTVIFGNNGPNAIAATSASDVIFGLDGNDTLSSNFATGELHGGLANDSLSIDYDYLVFDAGPYPTTSWSLYGDDGNDTISASVDSGDDPSSGYGSHYSGLGLSVDLIVDGGTGDDLIVLDSKIDIGYSSLFYYGGPTINNVIVDSFGDNTIQIYSHNIAYDIFPKINNSVKLGNGNDNLTISNYSYGNNLVGISSYDIDLGGGNNVVSISNFSGILNFSLFSGSGADSVNLDLRGDHGNSQGYGQYLDISLGAGNDVLSIASSRISDGFGNGNNKIDLGDGNDTLTLVDNGSSFYDIAIGGKYQINAGLGDDILSVDIGLVAYGSPNDVTIDLGVGNDSLVANLTGGINKILGGTGNDVVTVVFYSDNYSSNNLDIDLGSGTNTLTLANFGGSTSVLAGSGKDTVDVTWQDGSHSYGAAAPTMVLDLGDGDNTLSVTIGAASTYSTAPTAQITTGSGNDAIIVNGGNGNVIYAGAGNDTMSGVGGIDTMYGGDGDDTYTVDSASDLVVETNSTATGGADTVNSWLASYTLGANVEKGRIMSSGTANLTGNSLNNALFAGSGNNILDGGAGTDSVSYIFASQAVSVSLSLTGLQATGGSGMDKLIGIEHLAGSLYNDTLTGSSGANWLGGDAGNDRIDGLAGNDSLRGGDGLDTLTGGAGNDAIFGEAGDDTILYGTGNNGFDNIDGGVGGNDRIVATAAATTIGIASLVGIEAIDAGGFANVKIAGSTAANTLDFSGVVLTGISQIDAGSGNDTVIGSAGADVIIAGTGNDVLRGGGGDDIFKLGASAGTDTFDGGSGNDHIEATANNISLIATGANLSGIETISSGGFSGFKIVGTTANNALNFSTVTLSGVTRIEGGNGNDTIVGSAGADVIEGGAGRDILTGGAGADTFDFNLASHSKGTANIDLITDFVRGQDVVDLSTIDANGALAGDAFIFLGSAAFTGVAGQLRYDTTSIAGVTRILADLDGNRTVDMEIQLTGTHNLAAGDFLL
ncbi:MAG: calcium-binding protein [Paracoccaceae bacterium]